MKLYFFIVLIFLSACASTNQKDLKSVYILGSYHNLSRVSGSQELYTDTLEQIAPDSIFLEWPVTWFDENGEIRKNYFVPTFKRKTVSVEDLYKGVYDNSDYEGYDTEYVGKYVRKNKLKIVPWDIANRNKITHFEQGSRELEKEFYKKLPLIKNEQAQKFQNQIESINQKLKSCTEQGLAKVNSESCDRFVEQLYALEEKMIPILKKENIDVRGLEQGVTWWKRRTQAMAKNLCRDLTQKPYKKALIIMGWFHRYHIIRDLKKCPGPYKLFKNWNEITDQ